MSRRRPNLPADGATGHINRLRIAYRRGLNVIVKRPDYKTFNKGIIYANIEKGYEMEIA
jgi:hypothetical protein